METTRVCTLQYVPGSSRWLCKGARGARQVYWVWSKLWIVFTRTLLVPLIGDIWSLIVGTSLLGLFKIVDCFYQDPPCTLNWGYMVANSGYLGPNRG